MLCSWFAWWRPARLQVSDGEEEDWTPAKAKKAEREHANDDLSSHGCLMNGIGSQEKTDSSGDRSCPWRRSRRQHDFSTHVDEHPVPPQMVACAEKTMHRITEHPAQPVWRQKQFTGVASSTASRLSIGLERPRKHALDGRQHALQSV